VSEPTGNPEIYDYATIEGEVVKKYKKSDWQKIKERFKIPWSVKTLTDFWKKLDEISKVTQDKIYA